MTTCKEIIQWENKLHKLINFNEYNGYTNNSIDYLLQNIEKTIKSAKKGPIYYPYNKQDILIIYYNGYMWRGEVIDSNGLIIKTMEIGKPNDTVEKIMEIAYNLSCNTMN